MKTKMLTKINIGRIVINHLQTLRNDNTNKIGVDDILTFLILPIIGASALSYFHVKLNDSATNIIISTLSILVGLLFNVIVIIFDIIKRDNTKKVKNKLLNELLTNISYSIVLSILIITITLLTFIEDCNLQMGATWLVYFLIGNYFLTVLMILKRMYIMFANELNEIEKNGGAQDNNN